MGFFWLEVQQNKRGAKRSQPLFAIRFAVLDTFCRAKIRARTQAHARESSQDLLLDQHASQGWYVSWNVNYFILECVNK